MIKRINRNTTLLPVVLNRLILIEMLIESNICYLTRTHENKKKKKVNLM